VYEECGAGETAESLLTVAFPVFITVCFAKEKTKALVTK